MKRFLIRLALFFIPILLYIAFALFVLPELLTSYQGPNTKQQIESSIKNALSKEYELLVLGNSRLYRGINPDLFYWKGYNFSHDNDSYNQLYYKLRFLEKNNKKIKYLVLGTDYFQFSLLSDDRNYMYSDLFDKEYLMDYKVKNYKFHYYLDLIMPKKLKGLMSKNHSFIKENGQYIREGEPVDIAVIKRDANRLPIQVKYFERILEFCNKKNIVVFLVMPPLRLEEYRSYSHNEIEDFNGFIDKYIGNGVYYLNYSVNHDFKLSDFSDITHLNEPAANRFTEILNSDIGKIINQKDSLSLMSQHQY